jgi:hypothetical protein
MKYTYTIANQNFSYFFEVMVERGPENQFFKLREKKVNVGGKADKG